MGYFQITILERNQVLSLLADAVELGNQFDNEAQSLLFIRPEKYAGEDLILYFSDGDTEFEPVNLGTSGRFEITGDLTGKNKLLLQVAFSGSDGRLEHSDTLMFLLRPSLGGYTPVPPALPNRLELVENTAFSSVENWDNILYFRNAKGERVSSVNLPAGGDASGISPETKVTGIASGKLLSVGAEGKVVGSEPEKIRISAETEVSGIASGKLLSVGAEGKVVGSEPEKVQITTETEVTGISSGKILTVGASGKVVGSDPEKAKISTETEVTGIAAGKLLSVGADGKVTGSDSGGSVPTGGVTGQILIRGDGGSAGWKTFAAGDVSVGQARNTDWIVAGGTVSMSFPNGRDIIYSSSNSSEGIRYDLNLEGVDSPVYITFDMDFGASTVTSVWMGCLNPFGNLFQVFAGRNSFTITREKIRAWKAAGRSWVGLYIGGSSSGLMGARVSNITISSKHPCGPELESTVNDMCNNFGFYGKTFMLFGDSIINAAGWQEAFKKLAFPDFIYNRCLGGCCLTKTPSQSVDNVTVKVDKMLAESADITPPDVILIAAGLNDSVSNLDVTFPTSLSAIEACFTLNGINSVPLDNLDLSIAPAAMRYIQEKLFTRFPDTRVVFLPPMQTDNNYRTTASTMQKRECIRLTAERLSAGYIDVFKGSGIYDLAERKAYKYTSDGIHLNDAGAKLFARCVFSGLRAM